MQIYFTRPQIDVSFDFGRFALELQLFHWRFAQIARRAEDGYDAWMAGPVALCVW